MSIESHSDHIDSYYQLRKQIDKNASELSSLHVKHIKCQKGCDSCCEAIKIFPIEFAAIKNELQSSNVEIPSRRFNKFRKSCMFLKNGACLIYNARPIICRTQGLPLMYQKLDGDGYEISHCQLNFKQFDLKQFGLENSMFMPDFNSKLFLLNKAFIESQNLFNKDFKKRIPLYELQNI